MNINTNPTASPEILRLRAIVSALDSDEFARRLQSLLWGQDWDASDIRGGVTKIIAEIVAEGPHE